MKKLTTFTLACLAAATMLARPANYDPAQIGTYTLEDPLTFADGTKLTSPAQWPARRAEIVKIFEREMFGRTPPKPEAVISEMLEEGATMGGLAIRRQYRLWFKADKSGPYIDWLVLLPNKIMGERPRQVNGRVVCENKTPVPVMLFLNYHGNHTLISDKQVVIPDNIWLRDEGPRGKGVPNHKPGQERNTERKTDKLGLPLETILARGYAVMSACYGQISPDVEVRKGEDEIIAYTNGVFKLWPPRDPNATDNITAIGAWAWGLSRGLDLAERIPEIDAKRSVATGFSRLAKTPLLACSRDERFAVCIPNQTGGGGCPLAKRNYGENVSTEVASFPHWYCKAYCKYADNEQAMAFDQHLLIASIAPRPILVEGFNAGWFDTEGEFLACRAAAPVWTFLGKASMPEGGFPDNYDTSRIGGSLGYVRRGGAHGIAGYDWQWSLDFADKALGR